MTQPILMGWLSNNMAGHYKQSLAAAMQIGFGNCGGFVASNIFFEKEAPTYPTGFGVSLGMVWVCGVSCMGFVAWLWKENRTREPLRGRGIIGLNGRGRNWRIWAIAILLFDSRIRVVMTLSVVDDMTMSRHSEI